MHGQQQHTEMQSMSTSHGNCLKEKSVKLIQIILQIKLKNT